MNLFKKKKKLNKEELKETLIYLDNSYRIFTLFRWSAICLFYFHLLIYVIFFQYFLEFFLILFISIVLIIIIIKCIYSKKQLKNFYYLPDKERDVIKKKFIAYFTEKGKRKDKKEVKEILECIEKAEYNYRRYNEFYILVYIFIIFVGVFMVSYMTRFLIIKFNPSYIILKEPFTSAILTTFIINTIIILSLIIKKKDYINVLRSKSLFKMSFTQQIEETTYNLENKITHDSSLILFSNIYEILKKWYKLYTGDLYDNDNQANLLISFYRSLYITLDYELRIFNILNSLKTKIKDFSLKTKCKKIIPIEENGFKTENLQTLIHILNNYLEFLRNHIDNEYRQRNEFRERWKLLHIGVSLISVFLSILSFFISFSLI